jgi:hypothetical protein
MITSARTGSAARCGRFAARSDPTRGTSPGHRLAAVSGAGTAPRNCAAHTTLPRGAHQARNPHAPSTFPAGPASAGRHSTRWLRSNGRVGAEMGRAHACWETAAFSRRRQGPLPGAIAEPRLSAAVSRAWPFVLNTGRIRDQWHTMTRTGLSPRLSAHIAEPFAEIHPDDAVTRDWHRVQSRAGNLPGWLVRALQRCDGRTDQRRHETVPCGRGLRAFDHASQKRTARLFEVASLLRRSMDSLTCGRHGGRRSAVVVSCGRRQALVLSPRAQSSRCCPGRRD